MLFKRSILLSTRITGIFEAFIDLSSSISCSFIRFVQSTINITASDITDRLPDRIEHMLAELVHRLLCRPGVSKKTS